MEFIRHTLDWKADGAWREVFQDWLRSTHAQNGDDIVFVVFTGPSVSALRRTTELDLDWSNTTILWQETFYLNVITQCHFVLACSVFTRTNPHDRYHLINRVSKRVYASPVHTSMSSKVDCTESYPLIYFTVDDFDSVFSALTVGPHGALNVELLVHVPPEFATESLHNVAIFSGSVGYEKLRETFSKKKGSGWNWAKRTEPHQYIDMRGPGGKGRAQVAVSLCQERASEGLAVPTIPEEAPSTPPKQPWLANLSALLATASHGKALTTEPLCTCLTFINVHWESIVHDLQEHLRKILASASH
eukprot:TRINITY_DN22247_c0_g1_i1.p1 TRINITY_DN22247_c0_g1~~TRINITY_DN22247_c0_g1_i1.p1  ORF type:complete len:320 (-),score=62.44 TRINITY_DN22247_c0_g1_i1:32-940(-)